MTFVKLCLETNQVVVLDEAQTPIYLTAGQALQDDAVLDCLPNDVITLIVSDEAAISKAS